MISDVEQGQLESMVADHEKWDKKAWTPQEILFIAKLLLQMAKEEKLKQQIPPKG